jgi:hypothetical protein
MPLLQAFGYESTFIGNEFEDTLTGLSATHFWPFNETDGVTAADSIGSIDLTITGGQANRRGQFGVVGPFRGEPRVAAAVLERGSYAENTSQDARLLSEGGAFGGFFALGYRINTGVDTTLMSGIYNNNADIGWRLIVTESGSFSLRVSRDTLRFAAWSWLSTTQAGVANAFRKNPSDTNLSGDKWAFIAVVQRGDGTGPKLVIDGVEYDHDNEAFAGGANNNYWWAQMTTDITAQYGTPSFALRVGDRRAYTGFTPANNLLVSGAFAIETTAAAAPTIADIQELYTASNQDGQATDYLEYVRAIDPVVWLSHSPTQTGGSLTADVVSHNAANINDTAPNSVGDRWYSLTSQRTESTALDFPSAFPGIGYAKRGFQGVPASYVGEYAGTTAQAGLFRNAQGFDVGSIIILADYPDTTADQKILSFRNGSATTGFEIRIDGNFIVLDCFNSSGANRYTVDFEKPVAADTPFMLVYTQDGVNGVTTYLNGIERDGADIGTTLTGALTGLEWIGLSQYTGFRIGANGWSDNLNRYQGKIYDVVITQNVLTDSQQRDLYELLAGLTPSATVPTF